MIEYSDIPKMTVRELCELAEKVRSAPAGSKKAAELSARIGAAATYLQDSGYVAPDAVVDQERQSGSASG
ncbi:MAG: hypothetical protein QOJ51_6851 [Acidobacteriaceae bacterium]|jgi:hypothetical protein|nr:hypothetical protein [Acidobacteriaceae bacterium]MEA2264026.1 hypothetical protein [Acidobacteriaceae bacterium]